MPPVGTVVVNKLEQAVTVKAFKGRTYWTTSELKNLFENDPSIYKSIMSYVNAGEAYITTADRRFVLAGTVGEMWTTSTGTLTSKYRYADGDKLYTIDIESTRRMSVKSGIKGDAVLMDWVKIQTVPDGERSFAVFVPESVTGHISTSWGSVLAINDPSVKHGNGDFVVASGTPNGPDLSHRRVVNGLIFANTYDNRGWSNQVVHGLSATGIKREELPRLVV